jgi:TATA-box binding protein (TBP) (component of TFIID and TFIIIB)|tara:strand:- start:74 stop:598 length:525 start_codon:yes stop_codon:yes gene_type:complete
MSGGIEVTIETQAFRAIPSEPVSVSDAVRLAKAGTNGEFAVIVHEDPRAQVLIDPDGSLVIHGISNIEAATMIAEEVLLSMGLPDNGLVIESGEVLASFSIGRAVLLGLAADRFSAIEHDIRLDALRIDAQRHNCTIILFNNGRGVVMGQPSRKVAEMAASYWMSRLEEEGALA